MVDIQQAIRTFIGNELSVPPEALTPGDNLITNHVIDSLGLLSIVSFLEDEFDVVVADTEINPDNFDTVAAIARLTESKLAGKN